MRSAMTALLRGFSRFRFALRPLSTNSPRKDNVFKQGLERFKEFFMSSEKENFHPDYVKRVTRFDRLDSSKWMLIYRDQNASRTFIVGAISIPVVVLGLSFFAWDITQHAEKDRCELVRKLTHDCRELGLFVALPMVSALLVSALLLRVHELRVLRIYQRRARPDDFIMVAPSYGHLTTREFNRELCISSVIEHESDLSRVAFLFALGNMQVDRSRYIVDDDKFRANIYRTYMMNETNVPPRLTES